MERNDSLFQTLLRYFHNKLQEAAAESTYLSSSSGSFSSSVSSSHYSNNLALAVRAFGRLAECIVVYMSRKDLKMFLTQLLQTCERLYAGPLEDLDLSSHRYLSEFLSSFALILHQLQASDIDHSIIRHITTMISRVVLLFPTMLESYRGQLYTALTKLLVVLYTKDVGLFRSIMDKIVYDGVLLSISRIASNAHGQGQGHGQTRVAYIEYTYLWHNLLGIHTRSYYRKRRKARTTLSSAVISPTQAAPSSASSASPPSASSTVNTPADGQLHEQGNGVDGNGDSGDGGGNGDGDGDASSGEAWNVGLDLTDACCR